MARALDLKPEVTQGCGFESRLWQEVHDCTVGCPLLQVCTLGWVKCREHISLLIILCIIVYVTNKAHLSLICIVCTLSMAKTQFIFLLISESLVLFCTVHNIQTRLRVNIDQCTIQCKGLYREISALCRDLDVHKPTQGDTLNSLHCEQ